MKQAMTRSAVLVVGDEILGGRTLNTNAAFLGQRLTDAGFLVVAVEVAGDDEFDIADSIARLCGRADFVIVTGGLGPTPDDVTREALAGVAGVPIVVDRRLKRTIALRTGGRAPRRNARMARVPEGALVFENPVGTAAGLRVEAGGTPVYALPGVPLEMEAIFEQSVLADLERRFAGTQPNPARVLRVCGPREAEVADKLGPLLERGREPLVGVTVRDGIITITISGRGAGRRAREIRETLGEDVFGEGSETLAGVLLGRLQERGLTLAVAESLTGGLLGKLIVDVPDASAVFRGGIVAYSAALKHDLLGVARTVLERKGAVSAETALRMARGVKKRLAADVGLATTGVAGPAPGERGTPVGHGYVALAGPRKADERVVECDFAGGRNVVRLRFALRALDLARRHYRS